MRRRYKNSNGFTMAEMLITVAIIAILCAFGFVAVIHHQRNLKRMEMDETAQEIFIAAQNHLTAALANGQWDKFLDETKGSAAARGTKVTYDPRKPDEENNDSANCLFYAMTTESSTDVQKGAMEYILPEGAIDETLRGHHFYIEYDAMSGTVYGVFYTDADHAITEKDAETVSRTDKNARRDYKVDGKRTIIGYYGGALGELNSPGELYAPSVAVRNAESLVLYVVDKNYNRPISAEEKGEKGTTFQTKLKLTFEGTVSGATVEKVIDPATVGSQSDSFSKAVLSSDSVKEFDVVVPGRSAKENGGQETDSVKAKYYAIVLDSIVRENGHFADLFPEFNPGEDITITVTLTSDNGGEDVSQTVTVNSLYNSVRTETNKLGLGEKTIVTVSNARHLENLSTEVSGADFANKQIVKGKTVDSVSVVRDLYWDEDSAVEEITTQVQTDLTAQQEEETAGKGKENTTAFLTAIASATGMDSQYGYCAQGSEPAQQKEDIQVYSYTAAATAAGNADAQNSSANTQTSSSGTNTGRNSAEKDLISKGACYGITNTAIKIFEGNNHVLAAFRFEGKEKAALINEAADELEISDLILADATAVVTGTSGAGNAGDDSAAAVLLAKAKSGSVKNISVRWYEKMADSSKEALNKQLQENNLSLASDLQGCRIYSNTGVASAVIGEVAAADGNGGNGTLSLENVTVKTISKESTVTESSKVTAHLGIEGETASAFIGKVTSGTVAIDNSKVTEESKKSGITIAGNLTLLADKGTAANRAAGAYVGVQEAGTSVTLKSVDLILPVLEASSVDTNGDGGTAGAIVSATSGTLNMEQVAVSAHTLEVKGANAAGGAVGTVNGGKTGINGLTILTDKADSDCGEAGQTMSGTDKAYGIRITAKKGCAGGLIGSTGRAAEVTVSDTAVSGSGSRDQVWSGSSAGGLIGKDEATTTIQSSTVSLYVRSEGNGGNPSGTSSSDGAGGLIGSASGTTTIANSYSGGRTANTNGNPAYQDAAGQPDDTASGDGYTQGRYNVYLAAGNGAAGGLVGKATGTLTIKESYSTSSVAIASNNGYAGGLVGEANSLTARKTYCTGRVYLEGAMAATDTSAAADSSTSGTNGSTGTDGTNDTQNVDTAHFGYYAGKLGSLSEEGSGDTNYYLKGMNGAPQEAVGTVNDTAVTDSNRDTLIPESTLTDADYYASDCSLKKGVDTTQKAYYYDSSAASEEAHYAENATKYPFRTVTTAFARFYYHPVTGAKIDSADRDSAKYAQIGDWEVPEQSAEDDFGLIYYERIWDGTKNSLDTTFYYHGYMLQSGENAKTASYKEIRSTEDFVTAKDHYVAESGYLLLVKDGEEKDRYVCLAAGSQDGKMNDTETWGQVSKKITDLVIYPLSNESAAALNGYTAYDVTFSVNDLKDKAWMFAPNGNNFGILLAIREIKNNTQQPSIAAFTYIPFFADALEPAEKGMLQTVSKSVSLKSDTAQGIIRSADQLKYFFAYEDASNNTGFLTQSSVHRVIEQQLDITFDHSKVTFYKDGNPITDAQADAYQSPTLNQIGWANAVYRSTLRPETKETNDYYVLDGLRSTFVTTVYGELCNLQVTNIKAEHFLGKISGEKASVHGITITDAQFGKGTDYNQLTDAGFAGQMEGGTVADCKIINASIYGTGFIKNSTNGGTIKRCYLINATIWGDGFITSNGSDLEDCGIYADPSLYNETRDAGYYKPMEKGHGAYDYVSIGIAPGGTQSSDNVAGFVQSQAVWKNSIKNCFVAGAVYGSKDVSGFIGTAGNGLTVDACYANVVLNAGGNASGFAGKIDADSTEIKNCHALGRMESAQTASGFVQTITNGKISKCYEAFWDINAKTWYPFYKEYTNGTVETNYYLTECAVTAESMELKDYTGKATGVSYQELKKSKLYGDDAYTDSAHTAGYYKYMMNDDAHQVYPYPMPLGNTQTAYGDWSYQTQDHYSLLYYEKVGEVYYFHGFTTQNGVDYTEVSTSGDGLEKGLQAAGGKTVTKSGYVLVTGKNSAWGTFSRADNTGAISSPTDVNTTKTTGKTEIFKEANNTDLLNALKDLEGLPKNTTDNSSVDKAYVFQLDKYLSYNEPDTARRFAAWQTLTQESEGVGITVYSGKGSIPTARFSFQPFFADTVKAAKASGGETTKEKVSEKALKTTFVTTKDGADDHDYRVRSLSQLENLSKWDRQAFSSVTGSEDLKKAFDKESENRFSYLSTSDLSTAENCKTRLKIRQDMDIQLESEQENTSRAWFQCIDGTYFGRKYGNPETTVQLQYLNGKDFANYVTSTGTIKSLVLESASYSATKDSSGDISHGKNEFVEYNYGTLSDIAVQNSKLGSAGLVYQNGDVTKNVLQKTTAEPATGTGGEYVTNMVDGDAYKNVYRYAITYTYQKQVKIQTGIIDNCHVVNTKNDGTGIGGAGLVWRNKGGSITNSSVEGYHNIGASGFAEYNVSTSVETPEKETEYQYWIGMDKWQSDRSGYKKASDALIAEKGWKTKEESTQKITVAINATIDGCAVKNSKWVKDDVQGVQGVEGCGFVGYNQVNSEGGSSAATGGNAIIKNCIVEDVVAKKCGFVGENTGGATISQCYVYGTQSKNWNIKSPSMTSSMGNSSIETSAGFALLNDEKSTIVACSYTGQVQGRKIGGFVYNNKGTIRNSYANIIQVYNNKEMTAAGFVYKNSGTIEYCHSLGAFEGIKDSSYYDGKGQEAGFVWSCDTGSKISNSYAAIYSVDTEGTSNASNYKLFVKEVKDPNGTSFTNCYALKCSGLDSGYSEANGKITFVTGDELKTKTAELGTDKGATVAYSSNVTGDYPFPVKFAETDTGKITMTNYGDWYLNWQTRWNGGKTRSAYSVNLTAGAGIFSEESVAAGKAVSAGEESEVNAISLAALEDADALSADGEAASSDAAGTNAAVNELVLTLEPEESGEEKTGATELDLSQFTPTRKGWKLLGWLITSPSELADQTQKTVVSDVVTKINKTSGDAAAKGASDQEGTISSETGSSVTGSSEQAGTGSAEKSESQTQQGGTMYELEKGTKSYNYAPDAVITVTQDVTLAAVWVPDDDTIAKAKAGTLRMDESGIVLDAEKVDETTASASVSEVTTQSDAASTKNDSASVDKADGSSVAGTSASAEKVSDTTSADQADNSSNAVTSATTETVSDTIPADQAGSSSSAGTSATTETVSDTTFASGTSTVEATGEYGTETDTE